MKWRRQGNPELWRRSYDGHGAVEQDTVWPGYLVCVREKGAGSESSSVSRWVTLANSADEALEKVAPCLKPHQVFDTSEPPAPLPLETLRRLKLGLQEFRRLPHRSIAG
jgi:hypothetical protein